mmetsp:Transcript_8463/g.34828  ORF Transcript_8463/g.34828 Transcript_8463/m.34828 type:complete len:388 (+) Transcript_8463:4023-5186(+)
MISFCCVQSACRDPTRCVFVGVFLSSVPPRRGCSSLVAHPPHLPTRRHCSFRTPGALLPRPPASFVRTIDDRWTDGWDTPAPRHHQGRKRRRRRTLWGCLSLCWRSYADTRRRSGDKKTPTLHLCLSSQSPGGPGLPQSIVASRCELAAPAHAGPEVWTEGPQPGARDEGAARRRVLVLTGRTQVAARPQPGQVLVGDPEVRRLGRADLDGDDPQRPQIVPRGPVDAQHDVDRPYFPAPRRRAPDDAGRPLRALRIPPPDLHRRRRRRRGVVVARRTRRRRRRRARPPQVARVVLVRVPAHGAVGEEPHAPREIAAQAGRVLRAAVVLAGRARADPETARTAPVSHVPRQRGEFGDAQHAAPRVALLMCVLRAPRKRRHLLARRWWS